jgi:hypothetical protein
MPKTRSIPYWTTIAFRSTVADLVLIYESVTSSASVVRGLTLHSWTLNATPLLNSELSYEWRMHNAEWGLTYESVMKKYSILKSKSKLCYDRRSFGQSVLE